MSSGTERKSGGTPRVATTRRRRTGVIVAVVVLLVAAAVVVPIAKLVGQVDRISGVFDGLGDRPPASSGSTDVLVVGTGPVGHSAGWLPRDRKPMSVMVMHFDGDRGTAVVGIPLDLEVKVPGDGTKTIGDVATGGRPTELVATVEGLTGFRMDHLAVLDWQAFSTLIDRMGGISVSTTGGSSGAVSIGGIRMQVTGEDAMKVASPKPDVDSVGLVQSQLTLTDAVVDGSLHRELHKSPLLVYNFLDSVTQNLTVDKEWSTLSLARLFLSVWNLRSGDMKYVTVPVSCPLNKDKCRPTLDEKAAPGFWSAVEQNQIDTWLAENDNRGRVESSL